MGEKLPTVLDCPFCGQRPVIAKDDSDDCYVLCTFCNARGPMIGVDVDDAISAWNHTNGRCPRIHP